MTFEAAKTIGGLGGLSQFSKRSLNELISKINEETYIDKELAFHAQVDFEDKYKLEFNDGVLHIGYEHLTDSASTQETILLSENELDGEALTWGAKTYLHRANLGTLGISLTVTPGGGNTTFDGFKRLNGGKRFFACIIDSDKDHPKAKLGETAERFNEVSVGFVGKRYFEILPCHEIENIIPERIIRELFGEQCNCSLVFQERNIGYRAYPDHKSGLTAKAAREVDRKYNDNYWHAFVDIDDGETLCAKFGNGMLRACVGFMSSLSPKKSLGYVNAHTDSEWLRISKIVASWGIGGRGLRS